MLIQSQQFGIHPTNNREVQFAAGQEIRLRPGFESRRGSRFRAKIELMNVCDLTRDEIRTLFSEPFPDQGNVGVIPNRKQSAECKVFPNPTAGSLHVEALRIKKVKIFGIEGKLAFEQNFESEDKITINPFISRSGMYIIQGETESNIFRNKVIIKNL